MDKEKTSEWINGIIQDLTNPSQSLEDCLHKTLILAYQIKNDKLKTWVESELNGYPAEESVPDYRQVGVEVWGDLAQTTFGGLLTRKTSLQYQSSPYPFFRKLSQGYALKSNTASLRSILKSEEANSRRYLVFPLLSDPVRALNKLYPNWTLEKAWIQISEFTLTSVLSRVKTNLLQFLLALNEEMGNELNHSIMQNDEQVNRLIEKSIGHIHAENVTFGNNYQTKGNQNNVVQGNQNSQQITSPETLITDIKELVAQVNKILETATDVEADSKEDITSQLDIISKQANREKPKLDIIGKSLQIVEGLLINITSTVYTPAALELLERITHQLQ